MSEQLERQPLKRKKYAWAGAMTSDKGRKEKTGRREAEKAFKEFIQENDHPCLAAHSVVNNEGLQLKVYGELGNACATSALARDLEAFVQKRNSMEATLVSFVAVFESPVYVSEAKYEQLLWQQLSLLHRQDEQDWDKEVSPDPEDPEFSFSFAGMGFFIIGLHPGSSRKARRFYKPALVFNLHEQFEQLRKEDKFEKMRDLIRSRDSAFQGSLNPMVEDHGKASEARQYSGRKVEPEWKCPFLQKSAQ